MGLVNRKNRSGGTHPQYAESTVSTKLFKSDQTKFEQLCQRQQKGPAEILRQIVNEALTRDELHSQDAQNNEGPNRRLIEDVMTEKLQPVRQEMLDLKGCLREIASMIRDLPSAAVLAREGATNAMVEHALENIDQNILQIEKDYEEFIELLKRMFALLKDSESWSEASYLMHGHTFSWSWMILDFLTRYVVTPQIGAMDPDANPALVIKAELEDGRRRARKKQLKLESRLDLPKDGRLKFLSSPYEDPPPKKRRKKKRASQGVEPADQIPAQAHS